MLGAIIGDLAAWTWENNHEAFYPRLVSDNAKLSEYGLSVLAYAPITTRGDKPDWRIYGKDYNREVLTGNRDCADVSALWSRWIANDDPIIPYEVKRPLVTAAIICAGWVDNSRDVALDWVRGFHCGKQEYYAAQLSEVIAKLHDGKTKKDAAENLALPNFSAPEYLYYIRFAWNCFAKSWDFTSAIHNAIKCEGDKHLAAVLTGAIAEAMYGCRHLLLKKKYCSDGETIRLIEFPRAISNSNAATFGFLHGFTRQRRRFYPKNEALTNVEWHKWYEVENLYHGAFTEDQYKRVLISAPTDWDCRYGLYLDNGWMYLYRSCHLVGRFTFEQNDRDWRIGHVQLSCEHPLLDFWLALDCALSEGCGYSNQVLHRLAARHHH